MPPSGGIVAFGRHFPSLSISSLARRILLLGQSEPVVKGHNFAGCGKTQAKGLCTKGTALAGPISSAE
jgi:hypothetical protein